MNTLNRITVAALVASALALCLGCGADEGPSYLKNAGEAPPLSADQYASAAAEDRAVADEEQAEAAQYLQKSKGRSGR